MDSNETDSVNPVATSDKESDAKAENADGESTMEQASPTHEFDAETPSESTDTNGTNSTDLNSPVSSTVETKNQLKVAETGQTKELVT